jgi:citronellol/citronellal dehydrogenase
MTTSDIDRRSILKTGGVLAAAAAVDAVLPGFAHAAAGGALQGKTVMVTGASRGIGEAIARRFAAEGAAVACLARTLEPGTGENSGSLTEVVAAITKAGGKAHAVKCDITDPASRKAAVDDVLAKLGHVDILVNNAAAGTIGTRFDALTPKQYSNLMELNLNGPFDFMQRLAPLMRTRGSGWILNISSSAAELSKGPPFNPLERNGLMLYGVTKAALNRMTVGFAAELQDTGVAVNALSPTSSVWTPGFASSAVPKLSGRSGPGEQDEPVESMAEAALALCTLDAKVTSGKTFYSTRYLKEINRTVMTLDGRKPLKS